jgi:hypothetical protein
LSLHRTQLSLAAAATLVAILLGGERPPADPRFESPVATVRTFWQAVALGPPDEALECFVDVGAGHTAANLLTLPGLAELRVRNVRVEARGSQRAIVRYEVWYQVQGVPDANTFLAGDELWRVRGQWRIHRPLPAVEKSGAPRRRTESMWRPLRAPTPDFAGVRVDPSTGRLLG